MEGRSNTSSMAYATVAEFALTDGALAMNNLQAQIAGQEQQLRVSSRVTVADQAVLIKSVALRGQFLGRISDYEWAAESAEQLAHDAPTDAAAFIVRAQMRSLFHRFKDALADLQKAQQFGADSEILDAERVCIFQAIGRYELALAIYTQKAKRRADFVALGALATLHAERGEISAAEPLFNECQARYCGVSPFPLALLQFQRGLMWLAESRFREARAWFEAAIRLLPAYAAAQGHLAEVEAASGEPETAIQRLLPLTVSSDDPDYAASLARVLREVGRLDEAREWRNNAEARYNDLTTRYPEAFADHAAEFWLEVGDDAHRAFRFARMNLEVRQTPRAKELLARATRNRTENQNLAEGNLAAH